METPVALFVFNRPDMLDLTLACVRDAGFATIYAFSDGPRTEPDEPLVAAVRAKLRAAGSADVTLIEHERNLGLSESIVSGLGWLLERHDRVVVIEDDVWVAPEFGAFVSAVLDTYEHEDRVVGVTGLRYPFRRSSLRSYPYDAFMLPRFSSWGWATWRRAWQTFEFDREVLLDRLNESALPVQSAGADMPHMIRRALVEQTLTDCWDVYCGANMVAAGQLFVYPTWNMVVNAGLGTGTHPQSPRWTMRWETEARRDLTALRLPPVEIDPAIQRSFRVFTENPQGWTYRRLVPRPARMLLRRIRRTYDIFR